MDTGQPAAQGRARGGHAPGALRGADVAMVCWALRPTLGRLVGTPPTPLGYTHTESVLTAVQLTFMVGLTSRTHDPMMMPASAADANRPSYAHLPAQCKSGVMLRRTRTRGTSASGPSTSVSTLWPAGWRTPTGSPSSGAPIDCLCQAGHVPHYVSFGMEIFSWGACMKFSTVEDANTIWIESHWKFFR